MALKTKATKRAAKKIVLKKASAGQIIAGLKIMRAEERRARAAVVSAKRLMGRSPLSTTARGREKVPGVFLKKGS